MSKYKLRYLIAVGVLLTLPAFTCGVGPVLRDLIQRVEVLETESALLTEEVDAIEATSALLQEEVEALEAQSDGLQAQVGVLAEESAVLQAENDAQQAEIDTLTAEADTAPIVVDSNGQTLGPVLVINAENESAQVQFDLPDLPLFVLTVPKEEILVNLVTLSFESNDCTGQAWVDAGDATRGVTAYVRAETPIETGIRTVYVADPLAGPETISRGSENANGRGCEAIVDQIDAVRVTPVDLDGMFTPPFHVTTWERMQALR